MRREKPRRTGRPLKHEGERLSKNRTFRVRDELDEKLRGSAQQSGRSVSEEIEYRLTHSFTEQRSLVDALGLAYGPQLAGLVLAMAEAMKGVSQTVSIIDGTPATEWLNQPFSYEQSAIAAKRILQAAAPPGEIPTRPIVTAGLPPGLADSLKQHFEQPGPKAADNVLSDVATGDAGGSSAHAVERKQLLRRLLGEATVSRIQHFVQAETEKAAASKRAKS